MKRFFAILCATLSLVACDGEKSDKPVVKIGAVLPLSGDNSSFGESAKNGMIMALNEINADPNNKFKYEIVMEDGFDPKKTVSLYDKLKNYDKIDVLISENAAMGHAVKEKVKNDKILHISFSADGSVADNEYTFNNSSDLNALAVQLSEYLKSQKVKTIAIVTMNHMAGEAILTATEPALKKNNIKIVATEKILPDAKNVKSEALRVKNKKPDVVLLYAYEPLMSIFARELKIAGYTGKLTTYYLFAFSTEPSLFEGNFFINAPSGTSDFKQRYANEFSGNVSDISVPAHYDAVKIIHDVFEKYGKENTDYQQKLHQVISDYDGANGKLHMNQKGIIYSDGIIEKIENGKPVVVEK